jgi:serine/threonine protein kinase
MVTAGGTVQIIDFGFSHIVRVNNFTTLIARNARYSAPELMPITDDAPGTIIRPTYQSDIFSFAMTMLEVYSAFFSSWSILGHGKFSLDI